MNTQNHKYEVVFIVRPDVASNHADLIGEKFAEVVKDKGGKVITTEQWGLRTLAYRVKKHKKGYYVMLGIEANGDLIAELERQLRLSDDVIRFLSVRNDDLTAEPSVMLAPRRRRYEEKSDEKEAA